MDIIIINENDRNFPIKLCELLSVEDEVGFTYQDKDKYTDELAFNSEYEIRYYDDYYLSSYEDVPQDDSEYNPEEY